MNKRFAVCMLSLSLVSTGCGKLEQDLVKTDKFDLKMVAIRVGPVMVPVLIPVGTDSGEKETIREVVQAPGSITTLPGNNTITIIPTAYNVVEADKAQCKHGGVVLHVWVDMDANGLYKPTIDQGLTSTVICTKANAKDKEKGDEDKDGKDGKREHKEDRKEKKCNKSGRGNKCR